jgi:hypothetical protein
MLLLFFFSPLYISTPSIKALPMNSITVIYEDDLWYIYAGFNLDSAFETYDEAKQYLLEEGFHHE